MLKTINLDNIVRYNGLSYCWGALDKIKYTVELVEDSGPASVRYMQSVNHLSQQSDNILGNNGKLDKAEFFKINDELSTNSDIAQDKGFQLRTRIVSSVKKWNGNIKTHLNDPLDTLTRSWFTRLRIVQEACLSQQTLLVCGTEKVSMDHFRDSYYFILLPNYGLNQLLYNPLSLHYSTVRLESLANRFMTICTIREETQRALLQEGRQLENSLFRLVNLIGVNGNRINSNWPKIGATDPRDRIFSLLGLAVKDDVRQKTTDELNYDDSR